MNTLRRRCWRSPYQRESECGVIPKSDTPIPGEGRCHRGELVFFGTMPGLWKRLRPDRPSTLALNTGQKMHASPMSYMVDGIQYVALSAGSDVSLSRFRIDDAVPGGR